jgi:DNA-binding beta-propeller fold protein YncE
MAGTHPARKAKRPAGLCARVAIGAVVFAALLPQRSRAQTAPPPAPPSHNYYVYVGAESADRMYRVRFGPAGTVVERTIEIGELAAEMEGPHGLAISRDGRYLHLTTGHGLPDGKYWKYHLGPDTLVGPGVFLGNFPASIDITPNGIYAFSVNFNLHGSMVPSTVSVVHTGTNTEVARIVTCVMPHGSRIDSRGLVQYSTCMMDDQLVEIDARTFEEGPLPPSDADLAAMRAGGNTGAIVDPAQAGEAGHRHPMTPNSCSPTWAQPSVDGRSVFVACNKADEILEIDRTAWTVTRRFPTGRGVYNLAVTPDGTLLVATLKQGAMTEVFDLATGASRARMKTSTTVGHGVAISADSRYAFVSSEGVGAQPGMVDVYDLRALVRVGTVEVGQQASGIAFWKSEPVAVPRGGPAAAR